MYFKNLDEKFPGKNIKIDKEIDFDIYKNDIEDYIKDKNNKNDNNNFNNNGSFYLFISLISYIYINNPINKDSMNFCKYLKNKFLMKIPKKLNKTEHVTFPSNTTNNNTNINNNTNNINKDKEKDKDKENNIKDELSKYRGKNRSNSLYNSKKKNLTNDKKTNNNIDLDLNKKVQSDMLLARVSPTKKKAKLISSEVKPEKERLKDIKVENLFFSMNLNEIKKEKEREKFGG